MTHLSDETLNEYLDEALSSAARAEAGAHLAVCAACAARLGALQSLFAELEGLPEQALAHDLSPVILTRLGDPLRLPRRVWWLAGLQLAGIALAGVLAWPLVEAALPSVPAPQLPSIPDLLAALAAAFDLLTGFTRQLRLPSYALDIPSLGLPTTTLAATAIGLSLLWLAGNGLFLLPRLRRPS